MNTLKSNFLLKFGIASFLMLLIISSISAQKTSLEDEPIDNLDIVIPFGKDGQIKMLYDRRQRPQSVFLNGKVHIVFNADSENGHPENLQVNQ